MDEAERLGITIDIPALRGRLGIPVVGAAVAKKRGIAELRAAITILFIPEDSARRRS